MEHSTQSGRAAGKSRKARAVGQGSHIRSDAVKAPKMLIESLPTVPFVYRYAGASNHGFQYIGSQCRKLLGRSAAKLTKDSSAFAPVIEDAAAFQAEFIKPISQGRRAKFEGRFAVGRGRIKWLSLTVEPLDKTKGVFRFAGKVSDIDDAKRIEIEFGMMRERMSRAQEIAEFGWYDYNAKDQVIDFTPEFAENLGLPVVASGRLAGPLAEKYVAAFRAAVHPDDRERFLSIVTDMSWARTEFDFRVVKASGEIRNMFIRIHRTSDRDGRRLRDFGVILDITERKRLEENLRALAATDALTGVPNRRTFDSVGRREMERARRYAKPFTVIAIDIDYFKKVNDTYGHDIGDAVLKEVAKICAAQLRGTDVFARLGGEEFAALLPETDLKPALALAERLRVAIALQPIFTQKGPLVVTISLGVAEHASQDTGLDQVMKRADEALYAAKRNGRNRVETVAAVAASSDAAA